MGMPRQMPAYQQNSMPARTNKVFVASLEEALSKPVDFNTDMVYFDTNRDIMYSIYTNEWGQKTYQVFEIAVHADLQQNVAGNDDILKRIRNIEEYLGIDGKHNESAASATSNADATSKSG
jgi:hypothetical protein